VSQRFVGDRVKLSRGKKLLGAADFADNTTKQPSRPRLCSFIGFVKILRTSLVSLRGFSNMKRSCFFISTVYGFRLRGKMKRSEENRYPNSAELFKFCKEALNIKHHHEVKVIDQHVGAILGYDPADCSHWKKGKKNIKSIQTVHAIATHLGLDPMTISDLVAGRMNLDDCLQEYKGYGVSEVSNRQHEELRREFFRNPSRNTDDGQPLTFEGFVDLKRNQSLQLTQEILRHSNIQSCPVLVPELDVKAFGWNVDSQSFAASPHARVLAARTIGAAALGLTEVSESDELNTARVNLFAGLLLMPTLLMQRVFRQLPQHSDVTASLSHVFWVGRSVANARLKDFLLNGN
jgi:hypothetical protein